MFEYSSGILWSSGQWICHGFTGYVRWDALVESFTPSNRSGTKVLQYWSSINHWECCVCLCFWPLMSYDVSVWKVKGRPQRSHDMPFPSTWDNLGWDDCNVAECKHVQASLIYCNLGRSKSFNFGFMCKRFSCRQGVSCAVWSLPVHHEKVRQLMGHDGTMILMHSDTTFMAALGA